MAAIDPANQNTETEPETIRFDSSIFVRCSAAMVREVGRAARMNGQKRVEFVRQAIRAALKAHGINPADNSRKLQ